MSISDQIVVMKDGVIQQIGQPQKVYDDPINLFVAKFLGTPPINVFSGEVKNQRLFIGGADVLEAPGVADQPVWVGIRPEGFVLEETGPLCCSLQGVEVMGRDITVVAGHANCENTAIRAIISAENAVNAASGTVSFTLKPNKVFLFSRETEGRLL